MRSPPPSPAFTQLIPIMARSSSASCGDITCIATTARRQLRILPRPGQAARQSRASKMPLLCRLQEGQPHQHRAWCSPLNQHQARRSQRIQHRAPRGQRLQHRARRTRLHQHQPLRSRPVDQHAQHHHRAQHRCRRCNPTLAARFPGRCHRPRRCPPGECPRRSASEGGAHVLPAQLRAGISSRFRCRSRTPSWRQPGRHSSVRSLSTGTLPVTPGSAGSCSLPATGCNARPGHGTRRCMVRS